MSDITDKSGGNGSGTLQSLLASAERLRDGANEQNYAFIAYLADMTVIEIKREIERQGRPAEN